MSEVIEHTESDIKDINVGNFWLDKLLSNESETIAFICKSRATQFSIGYAIHKTLVRIGELSSWENMGEEDRREFVDRAIQWLGSADDFTIIRIAKCIMVLTALAEKRLIKTSGL